MNIIDFKKTEHYRILRYMAFKVPYVNARISMLQELGYKTIIDVVKNKNFLDKGRVFLDKRKKIRIQISNKLKNKNAAYYVVFN